MSDKKKIFIAEDEKPMGHTLAPKLTSEGFEVLAALKEKKDTTPVIVSSNLGQEEDFKKAEDLGAVDYLIKSDSTLSEVIEKVKATIK